MEWEQGFWWRDKKVLLADNMRNTRIGWWIYEVGISDEETTDSRP